MSQHQDNVYLQHIIDAIDKVFGYTENVEYNSFVSNNLLIDGVVRNLEIIGEASNNISDDFKEDHPKIDFRPAIGMRNWLAHGYDDVDLEIVWNTIKSDLPKMKENLS